MYRRVLRSLSFQIPWTIHPNPQKIRDNIDPINRASAGTGSKLSTRNITDSGPHITAQIVQLMVILSASPNRLSLTVDTLTFFRASVELEWILTSDDSPSKGKTFSVGVCGILDEGSFPSSLTSFSFLSSDSRQLSISPLRHLFPFPSSHSKFSSFRSSHSTSLSSIFSTSPAHSAPRVSQRFPLLQYLPSVCPLPVRVSSTTALIARTLATVCAATLLAL